METRRRLCFAPMMKAVLSRRQSIFWHKKTVFNEHFICISLIFILPFTIFSSPSTIKALPLRPLRPPPLRFPSLTANPPPNATAKFSTLPRTLGITWVYYHPTIVPLSVVDFKSIVRSVLLVIVSSGFITVNLWV